MIILEKISKKQKKEILSLKNIELKILTIYLNQIILEKKKIEYREKKTFYEKLFKNLRPPFLVTFTAGYKKNSPCQQCYVHDMYVIDNTYELHIEPIFDFE